jgi:hypothetical protein
MARGRLLLRDAVGSAAFARVELPLCLPGRLPDSVELSWLRLGWYPASLRDNDSTPQDNRPGPQAVVLAGVSRLPGKESRTSAGEA